MDVSGGIPRIWIPAIHAGMTGSSLSCFVDKQKFMKPFVVKYLSLPIEPNLSRRSDILIQVEQIVRVIFRFQLSQALIVRSVGCCDGVFALVFS
jgi:hypothetical protein